MGPKGIVFGAPFFNKQSGFFECRKPFLIEEFFPKAAIKAFNVAVLGRLGGIDEVSSTLFPLA